MKKLFYLTLLGMTFSIASYALDPIMGPTTGCMGTTYYVSEDSTYPGGTWSSSNPAIASVLSSGLTGVITPVSVGTCTISYTLGGVSVTSPFTVYAAPSAIVGTTTLCSGTSSTLTDATPGGTWSSSAPGVATAGSFTGVVTGVSAGWSEVYYTLSTGCSANVLVSVNATPSPAAITGSTSVCVGSTIALSDATSGGVWTSSATATATVSSTGVVTGISVGSVNITYTVTGTCGSGYVIHAVSVTSTVSAGTISGPTTVVAGSNITLTDGVTGGTWTSSNTAVATVGASSGIVHGVAAGSATITYTVTGCGGTATATYAITVTAAPPFNIISGNVLFSSAVDSANPIKVWLIVYNPSTLLLTAVDSFTTSIGGTSAYYQFTTSAVTDSYRVKAAYFPATFSSTGYIPTYYPSDFYWHDATAFYHVDPSTDGGRDITMAYGTVTSGPGFIGGNITTGANKGTTTYAPAVNMLVLLKNAAGTVIQQTYTNATGAYSFSTLPTGTYSVHPEDINFMTTDYAGITLTSTSSMFSSANFAQHTVSKTILPATTAVQNITSSVSSVIAFPNPTTGKLNIQWTETTNEKATISISDVTGREVYTSALNMTQGNGTSQIDLSGLTNGSYLISVKSATISYNNKIELAH